MNRVAFYFNSDKCVGCKSCVIACKDRNNLIPGRKYRKVATCAGGSSVTDSSSNTVDVTTNKVYAYSVSFGCNHCKDAPCVANCPMGAMKKRADGIVYVDESACIGCQGCVTVCPYGAPSYNEAKKIMGKCDMCSDLLDAGEQPMCVSSCLMRALEVGEYDELLAAHPENTLSIRPLPNTSDTNPSVIITPHRDLGSRDSVSVISMPEEIVTNYKVDNE